MKKLLKCLGVLTFVCSMDASMVVKASADDQPMKIPDMITRVRANILDDSNQSSADLEWEKESKQGEWAYKSGNYGQAEKNLQTALKDAQDKNPVDSSLMDSYYNLAIYYQARGQNSKADPFYEKALREQEKLIGADSPGFLVGFSHLEQFYLSEGKDVQADKLLSKLLSLTDKKVQQMRNLKTADADKKLLADQYLELAVSFDDLAAFYKLHKKYDRAEQLYKLALQIKESLLPAKHLALAASWQNLGELYLAEQKYDLAEPLLQKVCENREKAIGFFNQITLSSFNTLAECFSKEGKYKQAEICYSRIVSAFGNKNGGPQQVASLLGLAATYQRLGRYSQAAPLLKQALSLVESMNGPQHSSLCPILENYAQVLSKLNRNADANAVRRRLRSITYS